MILSTHYVVGMAVASQTGSPLLMPLLSMASHFILDRIPHWEYLENEKQIKNNIPLIFLDLVAPAALSLLVFSSGALDFQNLFWLNLGGFFGILPDGMVFLKIVTKSKNIWLKKFFNFHRKNHTKTDLGRFWGIATQSTIFLICAIVVSIAKNIGIG